MVVACSESFRRKVPYQTGAIRLSQDALSREKGFQKGGRGDGPIHPLGSRSKEKMAGRSFNHTQGMLYPHSLREEERIGYVAVGISSSW